MIPQSYYIETYGCQMNEADSELIAGILETNDCVQVDDPDQADLILVNSCSVRKKAEARALARLSQFKVQKEDNPHLRLGLLGCGAQNNKDALLEKYPFIDILLGPDSYRHIQSIFNGAQLPLVDVHLSRSECYTGLTPIRSEHMNARVPIMRGCDKFCTYCIVPYTRGRERSRPIADIIFDVEQAVTAGKKEVTLLGQNVNSYQYKEHRFPEVLSAVARVDRSVRVRFMSPHPQDVDEAMLQVMQSHDNICPHVHLPLQAGSTRVLELMNRSYDQDRYLYIAEKIKEYLPDSALTTDIIVGFPGEEETDFQETLNVMRRLVFDSAFMFKYSPRPKTRAAKLEDDVTEQEKAQRLQQVISLQNKHTLQKNTRLIGSQQKVLIEGASKKNPEEPLGRTATNKLVVIKNGSAGLGDIVTVEIKAAAGVSLFGALI